MVYTMSLSYIVWNNITKHSPFCRHVHRITSPFILQVEHPLSFLILSYVILSYIILFYITLSYVYNIYLGTPVSTYCLWHMFLRQLYKDLKNKTFH